MDKDEKEVPLPAHHNRLKNLPFPQKWTVEYKGDSHWIE